MYIHTHTRPVTLWHEADPQCIAALSRTPSGARPCARATEGGCQCACQTVPFVQVLPAVHTARGRAAGAAAGLPLSGPGPSGSGHGAAGNAALCTAPGPAATGSLPVGHSPAFPLELSPACPYFAARAQQPGSNRKAAPQSANLSEHLHSARGPLPGSENDTGGYNI
jgi:hypothetical protein